MFAILEIKKNLQKMTYKVAASINYLSNCIWAFNDFSVKWCMFI